MLDDDIIKERCAEKEAYFQGVQTKNSHLYVLFSVEMNQSSVDVDILVFCLQKKKKKKILSCLCNARKYLATWSFFFLKHTCSFWLMFLC